MCSSDLRTITVKVSEELHRDFKIKMVIDNTTMNDRIADMIETDVKEFREKQVVRK